MSEHFFAVGRGKVSKQMTKRIESVIASTDATFSNPTLPGDGPRYWFAVPNRGEPFNSAAAREVCDLLKQAGCMNENGRLNGTDRAEY